MICFVDTSAFYAVMDASDRYHDRAAKQWSRLLTEDASLVTTNYILLETVSLLQSRLGLEAVRLFNGDIFPMLLVEWLDQRDHLTATESLIFSGRKNISLVDHTSFQVMRRKELKQVFAFDRHFKDMGFDCVP